MTPKRDHLRMEDVVDSAALIRPLAAVCDAEVLPLVGLHLGTCLVAAQQLELGEKRGDVYRYPAVGGVSGSSRDCGFNHKGRA